MFRPSFYSSRVIGRKMSKHTFNLIFLNYPEDGFKNFTMFVLHHETVLNNSTSIRGTDFEKIFTDLSAFVVFRSASRFFDKDSERFSYEMVLKYFMIYIIDRIWQDVYNNWWCREICRSRYNSKNLVIHI